MKSVETDLPMPNILLFPASLRRHSHQRRLIDYLAALLDGRCTIDIIGADEIRLPLVNQDLETVPEVIAEVSALHRRFMAADGLIVGSPEFNGHVSPYLKNTVDWISRLGHMDPQYAGQSPFRDKPLLLCSASTGWTGGVVGLQNARSIFGYLGCLIAQDQICVSKAEQLIVVDALHFNPHYAEYVKMAVDNFLALVRRHGSAYA